METENNDSAFGSLSLCDYIKKPNGTTPCGSPQGSVYVCLEVPLAIFSLPGSRVAVACSISPKACGTAKKPFYKTLGLT